MGRGVKKVGKNIKVLLGRGVRRGVKIVGKIFNLLFTRGKIGTAVWVQCGYDKCAMWV